MGLRGNYQVVYAILASMQLLDSHFIRSSTRSVVVSLEES
jgi:hypothetical protein